MSHPFDATLKEIVQQHAADFVPAFGLPTNAPPVALNVDLSTLTAATDAALGFGDPPTEIADINFQSGPDPQLPARLHLYSAAYNLRYSVPVRSILVLLRPAADHPVLTGNYRYAAGESRVEFAYEVVRMWQQPLDPFLRGGLGLLPLSALCKLPTGVSKEDSFRTLVHDIDERLMKETSHEHGVKLMTATFILAGMRLEKRLLDAVFGGARVMHESSAFELIEDRAVMRDRRRVLLSLGRKRFGNPDAATEAALSAIKDLDRLERMTDRILSASDWQDLLATL